MGLSKLLSLWGDLGFWFKRGPVRDGRGAGVGGKIPGGGF